MAKWLSTRNLSTYALLATVAGTVAVLHWLGRGWWCECGNSQIWIGDANSSHTSQHFVDPYSFTHFQHGLVLFWLVGWAGKKLKLPWQRWLAITIECGWEILENTPLIIDRYRQATAALGYSGDSIFNSLGDIGCCLAGFYAARRLGWRNTWIVFFVIEAGLLITIRDCLLMNVLMLAVDVPWLKEWQQG